ncbi:MAG: Fe-S protein assembly chaperone HscA [Polyangiaceae bacterium]
MVLLDIFDPKAPPRPIGIDLGTTHSLVAYVRDGRPECIKDCDLETLLPSVVHFGEHGAVLVGREAMRRATSSPRETIVSVKRFMGRGAEDPETRRLGPYEFVEPKSEQDKATVRFNVYGRPITPIEVSAHILKTLRERAEDELQRVGGVVITVPAYFDDAQRQATKDAGKLAGLDVLRLLNEPTAAALAYGLDKKQNGTFAVYDLGGGTFDVTILVLDDGVFQVKSTGGDSALGGDDMDRALATEMLTGLELTAEERARPEVVRGFLDAARQLKHGLTDKDVVDFSIDLSELGLTRGVVTGRVTRESFDKLIQPIVDRTGAVCRRALRDAGIEASQLDGVILVGGSTRVPLVRSYVEKIFGRTPLSDIDPDQVVALGAAVQADLLAGDGPRDEVLLLDVLPLSLGIETMGGIVDKILPRNTTIPAGARSTFTTYADNQTGFELHVVQGERELASDCRSLARFKLKGIPPMPAGQARLDVTFEVDADGLLKVSALETTTGIEQRIEVKPSYGLTDEQVEQMLIDALDRGEQDLETRRLVEERVEAERVLHATRKAFETDAELLINDERTTIAEAMSALETAIKGTSPARIHAAIDDLDHATHDWAGRRMDRAIARAIEGRRVAEIESSVAAARGVEARLADERRH